MSRITMAVLAVVILSVPVAALAGHSNLQIPSADTFVLGGDQIAAMMVSGKNVGKTSIVVLSRIDAKETVIATVAPGGTFQHNYAIGETALLRNLAPDETAQVSVDFTGSPSNLTMKYMGKPKN